MAWPSLRLVSVLRPDFDLAQIGVSLRETHEPGDIRHGREGGGTPPFQAHRVREWRRDGVQAARVYYPAARAGSHRADGQLRYLREDREDLVYERSRNLPSWADNNPHTYFRAAERYERVNGVAFEEWKVTLPHELSHRQNLALTRDLVDAIAGTQLPITYAFHDPPTLRGTRRQPHLHLLISARQNDAYTRTAATPLQAV